MLVFNKKKAQKISLNDIQIKQVPHLKYQEVIIEENKKMYKEIHEKVEKTTGIFNMLKTVFLGKKRGRKK